jgi:3-hydroxybutyryl-CoA dehydrogenase
VTPGDALTPGDGATAGSGATVGQDPRAGVIGSVGVIGGGRMGAGIAHAFAAVGCPVTVVEPGEAEQRAALGRIGNIAKRAAELAGTGEPADQVLGRVTAVGSPADLDPGSVLVIEAVPELPVMKAQVLAAAQRAVGAQCLIASNTSSLSITSLSQALTAPERFLGMHFFNPVPASSLVEIVTGEATGAAAIEQAVAWTRLIGKNEIVVRDSPGFATSRLGVLLGLEAIRMVEEGVADAAAIDRAMELGYRHPTGPLRSTDIVGLDVRLNIAEHLAATLGPRFEPPALLREKVAKGELGRKSGQGFYRWDGLFLGRLCFPLGDDPPGDPPKDGGGFAPPLPPTGGRRRKRGAPRAAAGVRSWRLGS